MKIRRFVSLLLALALPLVLFGCSGKSFRGYEKEELSRYITLGDYKSLPLPTGKSDSEAKDILFDDAVLCSEVKEYPASEVNKYRKEMKKSFEYYASQYEYSSLEKFLDAGYGKTLAQFDADCTAYAEDTVKELLVLFAIAKNEGISVSEEEYSDFASMLLKSEPSESTDTKGKLEDRYGESTVRNTALYDKVTELLLSEAKKQN